MTRPCLTRMFNGRQRPTKKGQAAAPMLSTQYSAFNQAPTLDTSQQSAGATKSPANPFNSSASATDEDNTLPSEVTDVMTLVRLSWDFMTMAEVRYPSKRPTLRA